MSVPQQIEKKKVKDKKAEGISVKNDENANIEAPDLPILGEITNQLIQNHGESVLSNTIIIFALHFLRDLIPLVEKFEKLGCSYNDMYFLVKTYSYPHREQIESYFKKNDSKVFVPEDPYQKTFEKISKEILRECVQQCQKSGKSILIVEDGGYFAPLFNSSEFKKDESFCVGAVEQTTKGYRRDLKIEKHNFPIYTPATSKLKLYLEAPEVAETLQENIIKVLKEHSSKSIPKSKALILGYGTIGGLLAESLNNKGLEVSIYDIKEDVRWKAELARKSYSNSVLKDLEQLSQFDIVIGLSGETSLSKGEDFWNLKHNVILASGSSERIEFNLAALENSSKEVTREGIITKYKIKKDDKIIRLLCDGEPINFSLSSGIHDLIIDPIYAEMLWCAVELKRNQIHDGIHEIPIEFEREIYRLYEKYHI